MPFKKVFIKNPHYLYLIALVLILVLTVSFSVKYFDNQYIITSQKTEVLSQKPVPAIESNTNSNNSKPFLNKVLPFLDSNFSQNIANSLKSFSAPEKPVDFISAGNPTFGNTQSPITIVEFLDFECPACKASFPVMQLAEQKYSTKVKFVYKMYPLEQIHPNARSSARAALAAHEQGKFKPYISRLFSYQDEGIDEVTQLKIAEELGLDIQKWQTDKASEKIDEIINSDIKVGETMQVQVLKDLTPSALQGTPTLVFLRNNRPLFQIIGTLTIDEIYEQLEGLLFEKEPAIPA